MNNINQQKQNPNRIYKIFNLIINKLKCKIINKRVREITLTIILVKKLMKKKLNQQ